jgi:hypothetical protein
MKTYGGVAVQINLFLTSALGEWSASRPPPLPRESAPVPIRQKAGWTPEPVWTPWRSENSWLYLDSNSGPLCRLLYRGSYYCNYNSSTTTITTATSTKFSTHAEPRSISIVSRIIARVIYGTVGLCLWLLYSTWRGMTDGYSSTSLRIRRLSSVTGNAGAQMCQERYVAYATCLFSDWSVVVILTEDKRDLSYYWCTAGVVLAAGWTTEGLVFESR